MQPTYLTHLTFGFILIALHVQRGYLKDRDLRKESGGGEGTLALPTYYLPACLTYLPYIAYIYTDNTAKALHPLVLKTPSKIKQADNKRKKER